MIPQAPLPLSPVVTSVSRSDLRLMLRLVHLLYRLGRTETYRQMVFPHLPEVARFDNGHDSLMMGYDFHLTPEGPKLIEVNTNAGGAYLAWLSQQQTGRIVSLDLSPRYEQRLLQSFVEEWRAFSQHDRPLKTVAIMDEDPANQPLYTEMLACCEWLCEQGIDARVIAPDQLDIDDNGVFACGKEIDLIYNRHCDFFLESEEMADVRSAYLARRVCLSPNPFAYGLLADKRRMILWSDAEKMRSLGLDEQDLDLLTEMVPASSLLADYQPEELWSRRKGLIFKPVTRFGSRGVLMGKGITRKRFSELEPQTTLVQDVVPPSLEKGEGEREFKVDLRLFVYRDQLIGVAARLYQGQVTNLRTEGGGFAPVRIV